MIDGRAGQKLASEFSYPLDDDAELRLSAYRRTRRRRVHPLVTLINLEGIHPTIRQIAKQDFIEAVIANKTAIALEGIHGFAIPSFFGAGSWTSLPSR